MKMKFCHNIFLVCAGVLILTGCKTSSHTISRAEQHRENHVTVVNDTTKSVTNVSDSMVVDSSVTDSMVVTHWIETVITNTVDAAGNIIGTNKETNRTTERDHFRSENKTQNNTHNETNDVQNKQSLIDLFATIDSVHNSENNINHDMTVGEGCSIFKRLVDTFLDILGVISLICAIGALSVLVYKYIKGK